MRYCKANETADYCCIFGHFDLLYHGKLDSLCDTTTKLDVFVALQAFDNFLAHLSFSNRLSSVKKKSKNLLKNPWANIDQTWHNAHLSEGVSSLFK